MRHKLLFTIIALLLTFVTLTTSCNKQSENKTQTTSKTEKTVTVKITQGEKKELISEKIIPFRKGTTAMDVTVMNFEVETEYGGGFVVSIDGLKSHTEAGEKKGSDWFYGVNGEEPQVGATDYMLKPGDIVVWNFREWDMESITKDFEKNNQEDKQENK